MLALIGVDNPRRPGSEIVKAYVQPDPLFQYDGDEDALKEDITRFAKDKCSPYEAPKLIEIIIYILLTAVGKVEKRCCAPEKGEHLLD